MEQITINQALEEIVAAIEGSPKGHVQSREDILNMLAGMEDELIHAVIKTNEGSDKNLGEFVKFLTKHGLYAKAVEAANNISDVGERIHHQDEYTPLHNPASV